MSLDAIIADLVSSAPEYDLQAVRGRPVLIGWFVSQVLKQAPGSDTVEVKAKLRAAILEDA